MIRVQRAFDKKRPNDIEVSMKLRWDASKKELNDHAWKSIIEFFRATMSPEHFEQFSAELLEEVGKRAAGAQR